MRRVEGGCPLFLSLMRRFLLLGSAWGSDLKIKWNRREERRGFHAGEDSSGGIVEEWKHKTAGPVDAKRDEGREDSDGKEWRCWLSLPWFEIREEK